MRSATPGRRTLTATACAAPLCRRRTPRWTCASEAAATGSVSIDTKRSSTGAPSPRSIACNASAASKGSTLFCSTASSSDHTRPRMSSRTDKLAELDKSWPQALQGLPTGCGERGIVAAQTPGSPEPHGLAAQRRGLLHKRCPPRGDQAWAPGQERFKPLPIKLCRQLFGSSRLLHGAAYGRGAGEPLNASCPRTGWGGAPGMRCAREHGAAGSRRTPWRRLPRRRDEKERQQRHSASCAHPRVQTRAQARRLRLPSSRASCTNWLPLRFCS